MTGITAIATLARRGDRWWLVPAPARRLALLRIAVGGFAVLYLAVWRPSLAATGFADWQFEPVGVVAPFDTPLPPAAVRGLYVAAIGAGVAFTAGWRFRVSGPAFAVLLLWVTTYRNSWAQIFHTENLMVLHAIVLAVGPAADALSLDARAGRTRTAAGPHARYGWPARLMALLTVITYMTTARAKLEGAGLEWVTSDVLRNQVAYDNLRKIALGDVYSPLGGWLVRFGWLFPPLAASTLLVESGAAVALLGGWPARLWAAAAWSFHLGVLVVMALAFPYQLSGVAFLPFFAVEQWRLPALGRWRRVEDRERHLAAQQ
jgi:hypothetical protein